MARAPRNYKANSYYHVYNRGNNKEEVLKYAEDKQLFVNQLYKNKQLCDVRLVSYCIMDNHFHLLIKTGKDPHELSNFMQRVTTSYAVNINKKRNRIGHIFQGRYNANYLPYKKNIIRVQSYIRQNPVRDGIVKKASDYPWTKG
jgi:REP element-mobilizing transposase RayT